MNDDGPSIDELFEDGRAIDEALRLAAQDARRFHKRLGNPIATWRDDHVVWIKACAGGHAATGRPWRDKTGHPILSIKPRRCASAPRYWRRAGDVCSF